MENANILDKAQYSNLNFLTFQIPFSSSTDSISGNVCTDDDLKYPILDSNNQLSKTPPSPGRDFNLYRNQFLQTRRLFLQQKSNAALYVFHYPENLNHNQEIGVNIKNPVLLMHGLASTKDMLKTLASCIHRKFGCAVASFDLRGHGESQVDPFLISDHAFSIEYMLVDILNVIRALRLQTQQLHQQQHNNNVKVKSTCTETLTLEDQNKLNYNPWLRPILIVGHSYGANLALELSCRQNRYLIVMYNMIYNIMINSD